MTRVVAAFTMILELDMWGLHVVCHEHLPTWRFADYFTSRFSFCLSVPPFLLVNAMCESDVR